jgi:O-antigen/teichoic acid export membrane protein
MQENTTNRIAVNVASSVIQVIITGLVYFFVYRILVLRLGVDLLGVWSLIVATASISNLSNLGFSSAVIKYVAEYNARGDPERINRIINTSIISIALLFFFLGIIIYLLAYFFIDRLIDEQYVEIAMAVLPISLSGLFFFSSANVISSALEGFQKNYIRNFAFSITSVFYLVLAIFLIPKAGLRGLALAQVLQIIALLTICYHYLKRISPGFGIRRMKWDREVFRELLQYGYKMQIITVCQMLTDPVAKILVGSFHGITTLGFYEMASRVITQLRQIIAGMNQVTIPIVSHFQQIDKKSIRYIYERGLSFIIFIVFPLFAAVILFTPYLSKIWIGSVEPVFITCTYILAAGMLINILNAQAYFNSLGEGQLNGILIMTVLVFLLNTILGIVLGMAVPVYGVVTAYAIATALGSLFLIFYYQRNNNIKILDILKTSDYVIILSALCFAFLSGSVFSNIGSRFGFNLVSFLSFLAVYSVFFILVSYKNRNFKLLNIFHYFSKRV